MNDSATIIVPMKAKLDIAISELTRVRNSLFCTAVRANDNNDVCGVTFTCWCCREKKRLNAIIENLKA